MRKYSLPRSRGVPSPLNSVPLPPTLAKNARMGHPLWLRDMLFQTQEQERGWATRPSQILGSVPSVPEFPSLRLPCQTAVGLGGTHCQHCPPCSSHRNHIDRWDRHTSTDCSVNTRIGSMSEEPKDGRCSRADRESRNARGSFRDILPRNSPTQIRYPVLCR